ncbi:Guanylate kinase [Bienertia sinuspersici]
MQRKYTWRPEYDYKVRRDYEKKGIDRLKDHVNKAAKTPLAKEISWMSKTDRAEFIRKRQDLKFLERSERAKKNRLSGQKIETFDPGHRQGSVSTIEVTERMDEYNEKLAEYKEKGVEKGTNDVFLEVVGGQKKGKVYGLGSASSMFYQAPNLSNSTPAQTPSLISQLHSQVQECKSMAEESKKVATDSLKLAKATQNAHEKDRILWMKEKEEYQANTINIQQKVLEMSQLLKASKPRFTPNAPRDPHDPSGGVAPCAT